MIRYLDSAAQRMWESPSRSREHCPTRTVAHARRRMAITYASLSSSSPPSDIFLPHYVNPRTLLLDILLKSYRYGELYRIGKRTQKGTGRIGCNLFPGWEDFAVPKGGPAGVASVKGQGSRQYRMTRLRR